MHAYSFYAPFSLNSPVSAPRDDDALNKLQYTYPSSGDVFMGALAPKNHVGSFIVISPHDNFYLPPSLNSCPPQPSPLGQLIPARPIRDIPLQVSDSISCPASRRADHSTSPSPDRHATRHAISRKPPVPSYRVTFGASCRPRAVDEKT